MSSKFGFYPNALLKALGCFSVQLDFFPLCYGRRLLTSVVALSKRSMRLKSLTNLSVAGKEEHTPFGVLCCNACSEMDSLVLLCSVSVKTTKMFKAD